MSEQQLTRLYRPATMDQMIGQDANAEIIRSIMYSPETSPRSVIMAGSYGTGKTTSARLLARGLNCKSQAKSRKPCGECEICKSSLDYVPFYQEFDSSMVGNVETIKNMKEEFFLQSQVCDWRVVVFDECHLMSRQAQGALLKVLEEMPGNIFVIFCTTDVQDMLDTIRSRSIELVYRTLSPEDIKKNLERIAASEGLHVPPEVMDSIALTSRGHVRDSVMYLDLYKMMEDKTVFASMMKSSEPAIIEFLVACKDARDVKPFIAEICAKPLDTVRMDFYNVLKNMVYGFGGEELVSFYKERYKVLADMWKSDSLKLFAYSLTDWATNAFTTDVTAQAFLYSISAKFGAKSSQKEGTQGNSLLDRARKNGVRFKGN